MFARLAMIGSLLALPVLVGCKNRYEREYAAESKKDAQPKSEYAPTARLPGEGSSPMATREPGKTVTGGYEETTNSLPARSENLAGETGNRRSVAVVDLKLGAASLGTAKFRSDEANKLSASFDVIKLKPGSYTISMVKSKNCESIKSMETPYAGAPGTAGENELGKPGPATTQALWNNLGALEVDKTGKGTSVVTVDVDKSALHDYVLVIQKKPGATVKANVKDIVACGVVKESAEEVGRG